ncbi:MAG TPA: hypothetical protein VEJ38_01440 [Candidatus Acidoferrales bacterium]|nr:hypothetical protein [Candidatus Acidoferrales bacterium]
MIPTARKAVLFALICLFALTAGLRADDSITPGTILPITLSSTLSSAKGRPGQVITARIAQDVPLPGGTKIHAGAKVYGQIVSVTPESSTSPASISFRFDTVETPHGKIGITTNLRALASFVEVEQAQLPLTGPDRGTPDTAWTTVQIGGDSVYRGGGPVEGPGGKVGVPVYNGVLSQLSPNAERGCRGAINANVTPQALWVFSSDACGVYGLPNLTIRLTGRTLPVGEISLESTKGQVNVQAGAGILLRVNAPDSSGA